MEKGGGLWQGYGENIVCAFPADAIKFVCYEKLTTVPGRTKAKISPFEAAVAGAIATGIAQALTTPLDVIRNRAMLQVLPEKKALDPTEEAVVRVPPRNLVLKQNFLTNYISVLRSIAREEGVGVLWAGLTPRLGKAVLSGAIQFSSYELTKGSLSDYFRESNAKRVL
jgi:hypothetical protein